MLSNSRGPRLALAPPNPTTLPAGVFLALWRALDLDGAMIQVGLLIIAGLFSIAAMTYFVAG